MLNTKRLRDEENIILGLFSLGFSLRFFFLPQHHQPIRLSSVKKKECVFYTETSTEKKYWKMTEYDEKRRLQFLKIALEEYLTAK